MGSNRKTPGLRRGFRPIGDSIKLFTVQNRFRFVYQNYNYEHRFVRFGPIARYYINWPQEIDISSEPSEGRTFFTIPLSLCRVLTKPMSDGLNSIQTDFSHCGALSKPMRTSTELQFIDRRAKNCCIANDLPKIKELETIQWI